MILVTADRRREVPLTYVKYAPFLPPGAAAAADAACAEASAAHSRRTPPQADAQFMAIACGFYADPIGNPLLVEPLPLFLLLFVLVFLGIGLTIMAIVRNAQGRGPWILYVAAGLSLLLRGGRFFRGLSWR